MKWFSTRNVMLALLVLLALLPAVTDDKFILNIFILIFIFGAISGAWNILGGYGGQLSLGHALFFGLGAYTSSLLYLHFGVSPWLGMLAAAGMAMLAGLIIGIPTFRLRGPFFTLATIAFAEVIRHVANFWRDLTRGAAGISIRYEPSFYNMIFESYRSYYYLALVLFAIVILVTYWLDRAKMGYYLKAIREDEESAEMLGIHVPRYKMMAMLISSALTGIAGVVYAQYLLYYDPETVFNLNLSIQVALITIIGGIGTVLGPVLGAFLVIPLNEFLRSFFPSLDGMNYFIYGIALILIVSFMPHGLLPVFKNGLRRLVNAFSGKQRLRGEKVDS